MTYKPVDTAIVMVVGPCIDDTDFKTLEEAIAYDATGMDVSLIVEKTDGTTAVTAITLTTGGTSDWTHKDGGYYEVEVTAAQNAEEGIGYIRGVCTGVLPFESAHYNIVKANVYDSLAKGTDALEVDVTGIGGDPQSLTDLKDFADAGYDPATNKVQGVALVDTTTTNTDMVGTNGANTTVPDAAGVAPTAAEIKTEIEQAGSSIASILEDTGDLQANQGAWATATGFSVPNEYDTVIAVIQTDLDNPSQYKATGFSTHSAADVKTAIEATGSSIASILADTNELQTDWVDGGRLDLLLDAIPTTAMRGTDNAALASGVNITKIHGVALTETVNGYLAAAFTKLFDVATPLLTVSEVMRGTDGANTTTPPTVAVIREEMDANSIKMAPSQNIADYKADVSNLDVAVSTRNATTPPTVVEIRTEMEGTGAKLTSVLNDTNELQSNQGAWDTADISALALEASLTAIKGATFSESTDSLEAIRDRGDDAWTTGAGGSSPTVGEIRAELEGAGYFLDLIKADTNELQTDWHDGGRLDLILDTAGTAATPAEVATALSNIHLDHLLAADYDPASKPGVATALLNELVENDGGVSRYTANALEQAPSAGTNPNVLIDTTISSVADQTHFVLTAGSNDDDAYKDQAVVIYDASDSDFPSVRVCSGYVGSTKTITLDSAPDFTITGGDGARVFVTAPGTTAPTSGQNADAVCDEILSGHTTSGSLAKAISDALADTNELQGNQPDWATADITTLALEASLNDIKGTGFVKDTHSLPQCLTATGFSAPNEYDTAIAALQTDLDDPAQYKADVSALATMTALSTAQADLDTITGSDGATLATAQALYAPNKIVPDVAGTAAGLHATTDGKLDTVDTVVDAIKAKTDNLPSGLAKNVAVPKFDIFMVLSSDHVTGATEKTVTGTISKDGGAFAALTNPITEVSAGMYTLTDGLTQAERNADVSTLRFSADDCDDRIITIISS